MFLVCSLELDEFQAHLEHGYLKSQLYIELSMYVEKKNEMVFLLLL